MKILGIIFVIIFISACGSKGGSSSSTTAVKKVAVATKSATISWAVGGGTVQGYQIEQSTDGVTFSQVLLVTGASTTSATVSGLSVGSTYFFRIRAFNQNGNSGYTSTTTLAL